ncbi:uncharacterized protein PFL1_02595 [Pseudozyma flocculosa PF-1]|uniref:Uncharacterized protein n=1 Tax=Pseudozyma flocculosa PF-1 TaxID=1277687 RepID=A0A061HBH3_9BASI|nr:uncharacterized protein PFL1_02595 [Pseudozyma flocculosa PF-1]EPQ29923.1 hypothetical protein PFL1_02595 [Pseudozyma flocculosa PF-1]
MTTGDRDGVHQLAASVDTLSLDRLGSGSSSASTIPSVAGHAPTSPAGCLTPPELPRLPPELLEYTVSLLASGAAASGDPDVQRALVRLSGVSRLMRHWALRALYTVLVLPRHVRDFRKWYARMRSALPPFPFAGYTRALFCALDDISRLTTFSAGWDNEMLRMLHYAGPDLTHLSLWRSESTALLRDPGQVRAAHRLGKQQPAWSWGSGGSIEYQDVDSPPASSHAPNDGAAVSASPVEGGALYTASELQEMPNWLRSEIASSGSKDVTRRHKAHLVPTLPPTTRLNGCRPTKISIMLSMPLYEHEDPALFAMMSIWSRVEELDVFIPTPNQAQKCLMLIASLHRSPIRWLRLTTTHASLVLVRAPFPRSQRRGEAAKTKTAPPSATTAVDATINVVKALADLLSLDHLRASLINELTGHHVEQRSVLEQILLQRVQLQTGLAPEQLNRQLRIVLTQDSQQNWGKLKDRLWDFHQRVQGISDGAWELLS